LFARYEAIAVEQVAHRRLRNIDAALHHLDDGHLRQPISESGRMINSDSLLLWRYIINSLDNRFHTNRYLLFISLTLYFHLYHFLIVDEFWYFCQLPTIATASNNNNLSHSSTAINNTTNTIQSNSLILFGPSKIDTGWCWRKIATTCNDCQLTVCVSELMIRKWRSS
jgi:hypothetical protein